MRHSAHPTPFVIPVRPSIKAVPAASVFGRLFVNRDAVGPHRQAVTILSHHLDEILIFRHQNLIICR